jgi:hypothetical protein
MKKYGEAEVARKTVQLIDNKRKSSPGCYNIVLSGDIALPFLTSAMDGGEQSTSPPDCIIPEEKPLVPIG